MRNLNIFSTSLGLFVAGRRTGKATLAKLAPNAKTFAISTPERTPPEAMTEILSIEPNAKIVFISADANVREEAMKGGAFSFGLKPVTIRHMLDLVESAAST